MEFLRFIFVRVEVEGAGRGDIPAAVKAAKGRDTEDAE